MRKNNKFDRIFLVGLIPVSFIVILVVMIALAIFYASDKSKKPDESIPPSSSEHVCPKGEKVYIHDTVYIKVPQACKKQHVQPEEIKPEVSDSQDAINDTNGSGN